MNRDWNDFKSLHGNIAGAREAFETACESLFRKIYPGKHVSQVCVNQGDGGIDIFIGELGIEPITVIQCKFFLETFGESQKSQIRESFDTAFNSNKFEMKEWILCIPKIIDIDENSWWFKWKYKKVKEYKKLNNFISIKNGNELIDLFKEHELYNQVFKIDDSIKIDEIHKAIIPKKNVIFAEVNPQNVLFNNYSKKNELFYLEREVDREFINVISINNIWLYGKSGSGKTALINRNLLNNNQKYCFCDLSPININSSNDVLEEILCVIEEQFLIQRDDKITNKIKQITKILCDTGIKKIVIVIDELSVNNEIILKDIANDLIRMVTNFCNSTDKEDLKFVISTIANPTIVIENQSKANEHFITICCNDWSYDLGKLFDSIVSFLKLDLSEFKDLILKSSCNSPRLLKSILRKLIEEWA